MLMLYICKEIPYIIVCDNFKIWYVVVSLTTLLISLMRVHYCLEHTIIFNHNNLLILAIIIII